MSLTTQIDRAIGSNAASASSGQSLVSRSGPIGQNEKRETRLRVTPIAELLSEPVEDTPWLIDGLLPQGGLSILAGKPKGGKSTFARCVALAVARGVPILGKSTLPGPVIYLGHEDKRSEVAEHFRAMGAASEPLLIHTGPAPMQSERAVVQLYELIDAHGAKLVIIDTLLRFVQIRDVSNYAEVTLALNPLLNVTRDTGCHVMGVYHAGKMEREGLDAILGSVAIAGSCDTGMILKRRADGTRTLAATQRYGADLPETTLELDPVTRCVASGEAMEVRNRRNVENEILEALGDGELTEPELRERIGGKTGNAVRSLRELVKTGRVGRDGKGRAGDPFRYFIPKGGDSP